MYKPFVQREIVLYKIGCGWWKFWNKSANKPRYGNVNNNQSSSTNPILFSTTEACPEQYHSLCKRDWKKLVILRNEVTSSHVLRTGSVGKTYCSPTILKRLQMYYGVTDVSFLTVLKFVPANVLCFCDKNETTTISLISRDIYEQAEKHTMNVYV